MYRQEQAPFGFQFIRRVEDGLCIPIDPDNRDYQDYLAWVAAGGIPDALPTVTLDDLKANKLAELQRRKGTALATMQYLGYTVTLTVQDQLDVQMQIALLQAQPAGTTVLWELVNNEFRTWGLPDLQALQLAGIMHVQAVYANVATQGMTINAAADQATLDAIDLTVGWPT